MPTCTVDNQGRIVLPSRWRQAQGIEPGTELVIVEEEGGYISLMTRLQGVRRAQEWVRQHVPPGVSLVDELLAERRAEVAAEQREFEESQQRAKRPKRGKVA